MEKYVIDLDQVLDELELHDNDDLTATTPPFTESSNVVSTFSNSLQRHRNFQGSAILNSFDNIDILDADFAIQSKPPKFLNSILALDELNSKQSSNASNSSSNCIILNEANSSAQIIENNTEPSQSDIDVLSSETCNGKSFSFEQPKANENEFVQDKESNLLTVKQIQTSSDHKEGNDLMTNQAVIDGEPFEYQVKKIENESKNQESNNNNTNILFINEINSMKNIENGCISNVGLENIIFSSTNISEKEPSTTSEERNISPICDIAVDDENVTGPINFDRNDVSNFAIVEESFDDNLTLTKTKNFDLVSAIDPKNGDKSFIESSQMIDEQELLTVKNDTCTKDLPADKLDQEFKQEIEARINNMSEAELDELLSDLPAQDEDQNLPVVENTQKIFTETTEEPIVHLNDIIMIATNTSQINENTSYLCSEKISDKFDSILVDQQFGTSSGESQTNVPMESDSIVEPIVGADLGLEIMCTKSTDSNDIVNKETEQIDTESVEISRPKCLALSDPAENDQNVATQSVSIEASFVPTVSSDSAGEPANRGGLVRNIAYFERQEMPNGLTEEEQSLGKVKPFWIPDEEAQNCLHCDSKFTLIKRRHHCRSCGKVLCSQCCNFKAKLTYLENKEARVCQLCYGILIRIEEIEKMNGGPIDIIESSEQASTSSGNQTGLTISFPDPNNPSEYCSTVSPFEQASDAQSRPPPTVMVPVGVLKRPGSSNNRRGGNSSESAQNGDRPPDTVKQVIFSDGVRPGGDLVESPTSSKLPEEKPVGRTQLNLKSPPAERSPLSLTDSEFKRLKPSRVVVVDLDGVNLPPVINYNELKKLDAKLPSKPNYEQLLYCLRSIDLPCVTFALTKNLFINVKLIQKICCNSVECWSFASRGLATVGQDEVSFCLDCNSLNLKTAPSEDDVSGSSENKRDNNPNEEQREFPRDVFRLYTAIYDSASKASLYNELSHIFFSDGFFGSKENSGFIFIRPTLQCFQNVLLPSPPHLVALLIHKWEIPWAKVFPLRLVLRLGYEYKMYPSPIISFANRKPVYYEIGHTIMNVLADFRNFQYTLSVVKDLVIHVEERKRVNLLIPKMSYEKVCKVLSTSNEHVLAFGGNFSLKADSHFVCTQNEKDDDVQGQYQTHVAHFVTSPLQVTGASFIVFSGALKSSTGLKAKMNVVEDGLLVQIPPTTMEELRSAIRDMKEFKIDCCKVTDTESSEWIQINWINDELTTNLGVRSQIDGLNLEGVQSARIFSSPDYTNERFLIRWIEVFLLQINENSRRSEMLNTSRLAESVSAAFCVALIDHLDQLYESGLTKISLRVSLDVDKVGYEAGSSGESLPSQFTGQLDGALIPAIMENISTTGIEDPLVIELLFYILLK